MLNDDTQNSNSGSSGSYNKPELKPPPSLALLLGVSKRPCPKLKTQAQLGSVKTSMNKPWSLVVKDPLSAAAPRKSLPPIIDRPNPPSPPPLREPTLGEAAEAAKREKDVQRDSAGEPDWSLAPPATPPTRICSNIALPLSPVRTPPVSVPPEPTESWNASNATGSAFISELPQSRAYNSRVTAELRPKENMMMFPVEGQTCAIDKVSSCSRGRSPPPSILKSASPSFNAQVAFAIWRYQNKQQQIPEGTQPADAPRRRNENPRRPNKGEENNNNVRQRNHHNGRLPASQNLEPRSNQAKHTDGGHEFRGSKLAKQRNDRSSNMDARNWTMRPDCLIHPGLRRVYAREHEELPDHNNKL